MTPNPPKFQSSFHKAIDRPHSKTKLGDSRFRLHDIASRILLDPKFSTKEEQTKIDSGDYPRVTKCHKIPFIGGNKVEHVDGVLLKRSKEHDSFSFGGLFVCASVWSCPICTTRISQVRCEEISIAFKIWHELGQKANEEHSQVMVSFTIPHYNDQSVDELRSNFMNSRRTFKGQDILRKNPSFMPWKIISDEFGIQGSLSAIETTYGYNGWHPHSHDILFLDRKLSHEELEELKARLTTAWVYACKRSKVKMDLDQEYNMFQKSVHVRNAPTPEEYISKFGIVDYEEHKDILNPGWGAAQELTKAHIKSGRGIHRLSPWDFLRIIDQYPDDQEIYLQFGRLFREYSRAFFGGRQLFWSKGFKEYLKNSDTQYILSDPIKTRESD